ncbi:MAG: glycosyltransferase [Treponema sp.]|jgi:cellulose synthase/poly-beta-1,6-N-acetylglucosamine synthase-like glycosyltransferase|nr:glycosyltransferase [Treponema sp.]
MLWNGIRICFAVVFLGLHAAVWLGIFLEWVREKRRGKQLAPLPKVSVIVPIHNEEHRMHHILSTVLVQTYPESEFIFVEDGSTDSSFAVLQRFAHDHPDFPLQILQLDSNPGPNHKQYALQKALTVAQGSIILFTDADCEIPPHWIESMVQQFTDSTVGAVLGPVFKIPGGSSFFHRYQCFDHAVRYMYLVGSTGLGSPGGGFGNNLAVRRATLEAIGGYEAVPFSQTEDAALIARIRSQSQYTVHAALNRSLFVMTEGETTWKAFINQTLRWNNGGLFGPDKTTRLNFGFLMLTIAAGMLAIPLIPWIPSVWTLSATVFLAMTGNTLITLKHFGSALPRGTLIYSIQCLFTPLYFTFLTILGFCRVKTYWKNHPPEH